MCSFCFSDDRRKILLRWTLSLRKVVQSSSLYYAARLLIGRNFWYAGLSVKRQVAQSSGLYCAARLLIGGNYWYAGLSVRGEYWSKDQLELKIRRLYCSERLFSGQYLLNLTFAGPPCYLFAHIVFTQTAIHKQKKQLGSFICLLNLLRILAFRYQLTGLIQTQLTKREILHFGTANSRERPLLNQTIPWN